MQNVYILRQETEKDTVEFLIARPFQNTPFDSTVIQRLIL
jgi:hypothetical protein